jgi:hypothetical protein
MESPRQKIVICMPSHLLRGSMHGPPPFMSLSHSKTRLMKVIVSFDLLLSHASCFLFIKTRIAVLTLSMIVFHRIIHNQQCFIFYNNNNKLALMEYCSIVVNSCLFDISLLRRAPSLNVIIL